MRAGTETTLFEALDECHRQIGVRLENLADVARQFQSNGLSDDLRRQAATVESFFSGVSRAHHEQEEEYVFPPLLAIGDSVLVETVRTLRQEHAWLEARWIGLAVKLQALASGQRSVDPGGFFADVQEYLEVLKGHMELEDTVIYPESRTHWARAVAARMAREAASL